MVASCTVSSVSDYVPKAAKIMFLVAIFFFFASAMFGCYVASLLLCKRKSQLPSLELFLPKQPKSDQYENNLKWLNAQIEFLWSQVPEETGSSNSTADEAETAPVFQDESDALPKLAELEQSLSLRIAAFYAFTDRNKVAMYFVCMLCAITPGHISIIQSGFFRLDVFSCKFPTVRVGELVDFWGVFPTFIKYIPFAVLQLILAVSATGWNSTAVTSLVLNCVQVILDVITAFVPYFTRRFHCFRIRKRIKNCVHFLDKKMCVCLSKNKVQQSNSNQLSAFDASA